MRIFSSIWLISGITFLPPVNTGVLLLLRRAVCKTALFSVVLMSSPENIAWVFSVRLAFSVNFRRSGSVSVVILFFEKSKRMSLKLRESLSWRLLSLANCSFIDKLLTSSWCCLRAIHSEESRKEGIVNVQAK